MTYLADLRCNWIPAGNNNCNRVTELPMAIQKIVVFATRWWKCILKTKRPRRTWESSPLLYLADSNLLQNRRSEAKIGLDRWIIVVLIFWRVIEWAWAATIAIRIADLFGSRPKWPEISCPKHLLIFCHILPCYIQTK